MVAAKKVQYSTDDITYITLPGNSAQVDYDGSAVDDTVFGVAFKSMQTTTVGWSVKSAAFYKGYAGYVATVKVTGAAIAMTAEACTLVSGKTYQITATAKRVIDPTTALVILDNAVAHTADVVSIDYLFGKVTFASGYTVTGPVTVTGKYLPLASVAKANQFSLTMTAEATDTSDYATLQGNTGYKTFEQGLKTGALELRGFFSSTNAWRAALIARVPLVVEINPDGVGKSVVRGFFIPQTDGLSGSVGNLEAEAVKFNLFVPDISALNPLQSLVGPLVWNHTSTLLSTAIVNIIAAWSASTVGYVKYLPDGTTGVKGQCIITDCSLANSVAGINEFSVTFQGTDVITAVP